MSFQVAGQIRNSAASPTASLRSVLSRPRSAPQRRATISGTSPSHYRPYINVSEVSRPQLVLGLFGFSITFVTLTYIVVFY